MTREELSRIIKDTQVIFQVVFSYKISTYKDSIIILNENDDDNDEAVDAFSDNEKTTNNSKPDNDESSDSDV